MTSFFVGNKESHKTVNDVDEDEELEGLLSEIEDCDDDHDNHTAGSTKY